jgi:hypothetical protein
MSRMSSSFVGAARAVGFISGVLLLTACPQPPKLYFGGVRGGTISPATVRENNAYQVFVCPRETVTIGWYCEDCDQLTIMPQPGSVNLATPNQNPGSFTFTASTDVTYGATASNKDGKDSKSVQVEVLDPGQSIGFVAQLVTTGAPHWEAFLPDWAYTPLAKVEKDRFSPLNIIPPSNAPWQLIAPNNFAAAIAPAWLPINPPVPLVGTWRLGTQGLGSENLPGTMTVELGPKCP